MADENDVRIAQETTKRTFIRTTAVIVIFCVFIIAMVVAASLN